MYDFASNTMPWNPYKGSVKSVTIDASITAIGGYAFEGCTSLTAISLSNSITSFGGYAFSGCTSLTSIYIPDSVTTISSGTFRNCTSLASLTIPESVTSISGYAFSGCSKLASVIIPDSVTSVGDHAFSYCTSLASVTFGNSLTSVGDHAFDGKFYDSNGISELNPTAENLAGYMFKKTNDKWIRQSTAPSDDKSGNGSDTLVPLAVIVAVVLALLPTTVYVLKRRT